MTKIDVLLILYSLKTSLYQQSMVTKYTQLKNPDPAEQNRDYII